MIRRGGKTVFLQFHCTIQYACIHYVVQNGGLFLEIFFSHFISLMRGWGRKFISLSKEGLFSFLSDCQLVVLLTFFHNFCQVVQKFFFLMFFDDDRGILQNNFFCLKITFFCEKMISFSSREGEKCIFTKKKSISFFFALC